MECIGFKAVFREVQENYYTVLIFKRRVKILKHWVLRVFLAKNGLVCRNVPVDTERVVKDGDAAVGLGMIEVVAFVLEYSRIAKHGKAMREAFWYEKLAVVVLCQLHSDMFSICRRPLAYVDSNVKHSASHTAYKFALCERRTLKMQSAHDSIRRHALVVLAEVDVADLLFKLTLGETLEEISTSVLKDAWLNDNHAVNFSLYYFHRDCIL